MASSLSGTRLEENGVDIRPEENGVGLSGKDGGQQIFSKRDLSQWGSDQGECGLWGSHGFVMSCMFLASNSSSRRGSSWISRSLGSDQQGLRLPIGSARAVSSSLWSDCPPSMQWAWCGSRKSQGYWKWSLCCLRGQGLEEEMGQQ